MIMENLLKEKVEKVLEKRSEYRDKLEKSHLKLNRLKKNLENYVSVWRVFEDNEFKRENNSRNNFVLDDKVYKKLDKLTDDFMRIFEKEEGEDCFFDEYEHSAKARIVERKMNFEEYNYLSKHTRWQIRKRIKDKGLKQKSYLIESGNNFLFFD
jgi:hypothetical protein